MIDDDPEGTGDILPADDTDYTAPLGVPDEDAPTRLGFKDPAEMDAVIKRLRRKYHPSHWDRFERWARRFLFRMKR